MMDGDFAESDGAGLKELARHVSEFLHNRRGHGVHRGRLDHSIEAAAAARERNPVGILLERKTQVLDVVASGPASGRGRRHQHHALDAVAVHRGNGVHHRPRQRSLRIGVHMGVDNVGRLAPASRRCKSQQNARHPCAPNESDQTAPQDAVHAMLKILELWRIGRQHGLLKRRFV